MEGVEGAKLLPELLQRQCGKIRPVFGLALIAIFS